MKIFILKTPPISRPSKKYTKYPLHNKDYGVEEDFYNFITNHQELITKNIDEADWHYLPIFWTRWHVNHNYASTGRVELSRMASNAIVDDNKTFTICQYDDGPIVNLYKTRIFLSSRKSAHGHDIPLLCTPHKKPILKPQKKYIASFIGRLGTHKIREEMTRSLEKEKNILIVDGNLGTKKYVNSLLSSYVALCPRGYGGSSFRFFEAMQLGITPFLIGNIDTRPFKKLIDWEKISLFANDVSKIKEIIHNHSLLELIEMGKKAKEVYKKELSYKKWCKYVLKELND